jgi:hypothetical protein
LIYFKFIFVQGKRSGSTFSLLHVDIQFWEMFFDIGYLIAIQYFYDVVITSFLN